MRTRSTRMNAATISTRNSRPIPATTAPMNFWPYSSARRLSPSVDLSRSDSHCLIDRSHLPPAPVPESSECGGAMTYRPSGPGRTSSASESRSTPVASLAHRLEDDGMRRGRCDRPA